MVKEVQLSQRRASKDSGFALVGLCLVTPFIAMLFYAVGWSFWTVNQREKAQFFCQTKVLQAQKQLISASKSVVALNARVHYLRLKKTLLMGARRVTPLPAKLVIIAKIAQVKAQQVALHAQQKTLLSLGKFQARMTLRLLRRKLKSHLKEIGRHPWLVQSQTPRVTASVIRVGVVPRSRRIAPLYKFPKNYGSRQQLQVRWKASMKLKTFLKAQTKPQWSGTCLSHPKKRRGRWTANLGRDKSLWNLSGI